MEFSICRGVGGSDGVIFHMFSATPPSHEAWIEIFLSIFGLLRGKIKNVLELPKNHLKTARVHPRDTEG